MSTLKVDDALQAIAALQQEKEVLLAALKRLGSVAAVVRIQNTVEFMTYLDEHLRLADEVIANAEGTK